MGYCSSTGTGSSRGRYRLPPPRANWTTHMPLKPLPPSAEVTALLMDFAHESRQRVASLQRAIRLADAVRDPQCPELTRLDRAYAQLEQELSDLLRVRQG